MILKRTFEFLSNNFHLAASTIAAIYKDRWKEGWSVQRLLRIIQVNLFERKLLKALFLPDKKWNKQEEPQLRFFL